MAVVVMSANQDGPPRFTLDPLRSDGPDALTTDTADGIHTVRLGKIVIAFENLSHHVLTAVADDLYEPAAPGAPDQDLIPKGALMTHAILTFLLPGSPRPHAVEIHPPNRIKFESPAHATILGAWLAKHHFTAPPS